MSMSMLYSIREFGIKKKKKKKKKEATMLVV
jgi:hypothetical protein